MIKRYAITKQKKKTSIYKSIFDVQVIPIKIPFLGKAPKDMVPLCL